MNGMSKIFLIVLIWETTWLVAFVVYRCIISVQEKRKKGEQEQGVKRTHYVIRNKMILAMFFTIGTAFFSICAILCWLTLLGNIEIINENFKGADVWSVCCFVVLSLLGLVCTLNTLLWKLEVNGEEIVWRSTFGVVRRFRFDDITECEIRDFSICVYVNNKKMLHIDDNIDCKEFMEDMKRHGIRETDVFTKKMERRKKKH